MNIQPKSGSVIPETETTGPLTGSRKVYAEPKSHPGVRVPSREIMLTDPLEPPLFVYDASGPYTEVDARIDLSKGLPRVRDAWLDKRGYETYTGRALKPDDNGLVSGDRLVPACPANVSPRRARDGQMVTQYEFARAGIITEEMVYVAHRENLGREKMLAGAEAKIADGESIGAELVGEPRGRRPVEQVLGQRRAVVGFVRLVADDRQRTLETLLPQRLRGTQPGQRGADDDDTSLGPELLDDLVE